MVHEQRELSDTGEWDRKKVRLPDDKKMQFLMVQAPFNVSVTGLDCM